MRGRQGWRNLPSDAGAYVGRLTASCATLASYTWFVINKLFLLIIQKLNFRDKILMKRKSSQNQVRNTTISLSQHMHQLITHACKYILSLSLFFSVNLILTNSLTLTYCYLVILRRLWLSYRCILLRKINDEFDH